jgi:tetratricopeptide (TPR) repeat protein
VRVIDEGSAIRDDLRVLPLLLLLAGTGMVSNVDARRATLEGDEDAPPVLDLVEQGVAYRVNGSCTESEAVLLRAVKILESSPERDHLLMARSEAELGTTYYCLGQYSQAVHFLQRGLAVFERMRVEREFGQFFVNIGDAYFASGQLNRAEMAWQCSLTALGGSPGEEALKALTLCHLGKLKLLRGRRIEAESLIFEAVSIAETLGPSSDVLLPALSSLGDLYASTGESQRAEEAYQRALALALSTPGPQHPDTAVVLRSLGQVRISQARFNEAAELYERALAVAERALGTEHPIYGTYVSEYAALLRKMKRKGEAKKLEAQAKIIREQIRAPTAGEATVDIHDLPRQRR